MEREPSAGSAIEAADQRQEELSWLRPILVLAGLAGLVSAACGVPAGSPPPSFDLVERTIPELQQAMADGRVTSRVLVEQYLARIEAYDQRGPRLNAMISINAAAREEADALDRERAATGPRSPLHGIPVVVKDNYDVVGMPTTAGSIALAHWYPPDDSFQVARLKEAGAIILGKANMHEFAYGMTTVSSMGGQTRNPYDPSRNPGGSSGGTGAAVAANYAAAGMGTDTCGSIRIPSFHHALVGLRGTHGLSSRDGIVPLALTQDMGGPLTKTVTDMALMLDATVGVDASDDVTLRSEGRIPESYTQQLADATLDGARIGVVGWLLGDAPEDQPVAEVIRAALNEIEAAGGQVVEVELAGVPELLDGVSLVSTEFPRQLADYLAAPGTPVRTLAEVLERGLYHAAVEERYTRSLDAGGYDDPTYQAALGQREPLRIAVSRVLRERRLDAIAYPTLRRTAAHIGDPQRGNNCAISARSGLPAVVVPAGYADDGMPVGLELLGPEWSEADLLGLAYAYEQQTRHRRPPSTTPALAAEASVAQQWLAAEARLRVTWTAATGELRYDATAYGVSDADVLFADIHRAEAGEVGPVAIALPGSGRARISGSLRLTPTQRGWLESGRLYLDFHTRQQPAGTRRIQIDRVGGG